MARSLSNAKLLSSLLADQVSLVATTRGYAAVSQGASSGSAAMRGGVMGAKKVEESSRCSPWVPDPVTGYYRPENHGNDIDVAELREMILKNKFSRQH